MRAMVGERYLTSLRSKVARRILLLFIVCALLPVAALAYISFNQVTQHLQAQSQRRLRQTSKAAAFNLYERLLFLEAEMKTMASVLTAGGRPQLSKEVDELGGDLRQRFIGLSVMTPLGTPRPVLGRAPPPPRLTAEQRAHIKAGRTLLSVRRRADLPPRIFMTMLLDPREVSGSFLLAEINPSYLWRMAERESLPGATEMTVLDEFKQPLVSSTAVSTIFSQKSTLLAGQSCAGEFEWPHDGEIYLATCWPLPLGFRFHVPSWTVVLSESKSHALAPLRQFKTTFPLVILLTLGLVLLLSINQIRRTLVPLEQLREGTRRIANREFARPVTVSSGDELQELAASFNAMARQLQKQFSALATIAEIDRAVLSALDTEKILETVITRIGDVFPCEQVAAVLFDEGGGTAARLYLRNRGPEGGTGVATILLKPEEVEARCASRETVWIVRQEGGSHPLAPLFNPGIHSLLVMPIYLSDRLSAIIALGYQGPASLNDEDLLQARQLSDQVAVALHNSRLYEKTKRQTTELEQANRAKDDFISVMSHELRTPLTVIMGFTGMLRDGLVGKITPKQDEVLASVTQAAVDLLDSVNTIIQGTTIESGEAKVEPQEFPLKRFLDELRLFYSAHLSKELTLQWDYPDDLPSVRLDKIKTRNILKNLIDNAVKFTAKGRVTIRARYLSAGRLVQFQISDTGIGIPKEALPLIFEKFRQVDGSGRRVYGGVGLGLFIVKKFTDLLGGKVEIESEPGKGSTFTLTLPSQA